MTGDVFEEHPFRIALADDAGDVGPQVAGIVLPAPLSGVAERLAGIAGKDGVDCATEGPPIEGGNVIPDWRRGEISSPLTGDEAGSRVFFPLDIAAGVEAGFGEHEAHIKATAACAEGQSVSGT